MKYWGKHPKWEKYHIPTKSSISFTVDKLFTKAKVKTVPGKGKVKEFILNGKKYKPETKEWKKVQEYIYKLGKYISKEFLKYDYKIVSENNFPTASGLASSASGFAALSKALFNELSKYHSWAEEIAENEKKLSAIARLGSGSAARSISNGIVIWKRGWDRKKFNPLWDSYGEKIALAPKDILLFYVFITKRPKKISSREGMKRSIETCPFYWQWVEKEEKEIRKDKALIKRKKWEKLFPRIIQHSNSFHAICRASYPPIEYLNAESIKLIEKIHDFIKEYGNIMAYTFDAGPNPVIFVLKDFEEEVKNKIFRNMKYLATTPR